MAVPSLPTALNTNDVVDNSWVDAVRDLLEWGRDTRPYYKGRATATGDPMTLGIDVATATNTTFGFGSSGSLSYVTTNVGGWTSASADANPESLVVPEAGIHAAVIAADFEGNSTGYRRVRLLVNGSTDDTVGMQVDAATTVDTRIVATGYVDLAASDELDVQLYQDSGSTLEVNVFASFLWVQST